MEVGAGGPVSGDPPMVALPIRHKHHTLKGIMENKTFSVNIPMLDLVKESDYCGIISGRDTDKAKDCHFDIFYGKLQTAPMITQCAVNLECSLYQIINTNSHAIVMGQIHATFISAEFTKDGKPDFDKINPLLWSENKAEYFGVGQSYGKSRSIGKEIKRAD
jgi:flavin reductase (DIM6/NTAB) family NADH-FMN oxidoreductase RutF